MSWHQLSSKYPGTCVNCKEEYNSGTLILWDDNSKKTKHYECKISSIKNTIHKINFKTENVLNKWNPRNWNPYTNRYETYIQSSKQIEPKKSKNSRRKSVKIMTPIMTPQYTQLPFEVNFVNQDESMWFGSVDSNIFTYNKREREFLRDSLN
jgi:t-SNARE complex subunit (syntaxin)